MLRLIAMLSWTAALALTVIGVARVGNAHEGHDHGAPPPPISNTIAPRAEASSSDFEVVVIARGGDLLIHLDTFRTNAPVAGAAIEIDTPAGQLAPADKGNGVYAANASFLMTPGSYDLAITVTAQHTVDILATTLIIPDGTSSAVTVRGGSWISNSAFAQELRDRVGNGGRSLWLAVIVGFVAGVLVTFLLGRRRKAASLVAIAALAAILMPMN